MARDTGFEGRLRQGGKAGAGAARQEERSGELSAAAQAGGGGGPGAADDPAEGCGGGSPGGGAGGGHPRGGRPRGGGGEAGRAASGGRPLMLKSDAVFRRVFAASGNEAILASFLSAVLGEEIDPGGLAVQDPALKGAPGAKEPVVDVLATAADGRRMHIEVQLARPRGFERRVAYYTASLLASQLARGDDYDSLARVVSIVITDFCWRGGGGFANRYRLCSQDTGELFCDIMEVHTLELPKVPADADALLPQWMRLIAASSYQELEEVRQADSAIGEVVDMIWELSEEESVRIQEEKKEKYRRDMVAVRLQGLDEGRAEGMEAGRAEGRASVVSAMLSNGLSAAEVAKLTGIGVEEVMALA